LADGFDICRIDARDAPSVMAALEPGDVLVNATTPAGALGHGLAKAAITAGAHYVAFSGEVADTLRLLRELDKPARERGVTLCAGAGSALPDFAVRLALQQLPDATDGCTGISLGDFVPSYGTLQSEMHIMNGPGVVIQDGDLIEEVVVGKVIRHGALTFVERPLIDPLMVWTYARLRSFRSGINVPPEAVDSTVGMFVKTAETLKSEAGRTTYLEQISAFAGRRIPENEGSLQGRVTAVVWNGSRQARIVVTARPIYENTARAALLVSRELDELKDRAAGFQAPSTIVRSIEFGLEALSSTIVDL